MLLFASSAAAQTVAYVLNIGSDSVSVVDVLHRTVLGEPIAVGYRPETIIANSAGTHVYVANTYYGSVSVIDVATNTVIALIDDISDAHGFAFDADGTHLYVAGGNGITTLDTATNTVSGDPIPVMTPDECGGSSGNLALSPDGIHLYVPALVGCLWSDPFRDNGAVSVIDLQQRKPVAEIPVGIYPTNASVSPDGTRVYVTNWGENSISIIDTATNLSTKAELSGTGNFPVNAVLNADGSQLLIADDGSGNLSMLDTQSGSASAAGIPVSDELWGIATADDGRTLLVTDYRHSAVSLVDVASRSVLATIPVGSEPVGVATVRDRFFANGFE